MKTISMNRVPDEDRSVEDNSDEDTFNEDQFDLLRRSLLELTKTISATRILTKIIFRLDETISAKRISMKPTFRLDEDHFDEENYQKAHFWT